MIDAPVGRTSEQAKTGNLLIMAVERRRREGRGRYLNAWATRLSIVAGPAWAGA